MASLSRTLVNGKDETQILLSKSSVRRRNYFRRMRDLVVRCSRRLWFCLESLKLYNEPALIIWSRESGGDTAGASRGSIIHSQADAASRYPGVNQRAASSRRETLVDSLICKPQFALPISTSLMITSRAFHYVGPVEIPRHLTAI